MSNIGVVRASCAVVLTLCGHSVCVHRLKEPATRCANARNLCFVQARRPSARNQPTRPRRMVSDMHASETGMIPPGRFPSTEHAVASSGTRNEDDTAARRLPNMWPAWPDLASPTPTLFRRCGKPSTMKVASHAAKCDADLVYEGSHAECAFMPEDARWKRWRLLQAQAGRAGVSRLGQVSQSARLPLSSSGYYGEAAPRTEFPEGLFHFRKRQARHRAEDREFDGPIRELPTTIGLRPPQKVTSQQGGSVP